ncbi:MAG: hypothetical protein E7674_07520 [Ruminococcaceae bacterium]|nr:hypothetical protein [Oscillospiraceae bacterium]
MKKTVVYTIIVLTLFLFGCNAVADIDTENIANGSAQHGESYEQSAEESEPAFENVSEESDTPSEESGTDDIVTADFDCLYLLSDGTSTKVDVTRCDVNIAGYGEYSVENPGIVYCEPQNGDGAYLISLNVGADSVTVLSWDADMWAAGIVGDGIPVELIDGTAVFGGRNIYCITVEWYEDNPLCSGKAEYWFAVCEFID